MWLPQLSPPMAILVGMIIGLLTYTITARMLLGFIYPRRIMRVSFEEYTAWVLTVLFGAIAYIFSADLLVRDKCMEVCRNAPDPWGAWFIVYVSLALAWLVLICRGRERLHPTGAGCSGRPVPGPRSVYEYEQEEE